MSERMFRVLSHGASVCVFPFSAFYSLERTNRDQTQTNNQSISNAIYWKSFRSSEIYFRAIFVYRSWILISIFNSFRRRFFSHLFFLLLMSMWLDLCVCVIARTLIADWKTWTSNKEKTRGKKSERKKTQMKLHWRREREPWAVENAGRYTAVSEWANDTWTIKQTCRHKQERTEPMHGTVHETLEAVVLKWIHVVTYESQTNRRWTNVCHLNGTEYALQVDVLFVFVFNNNNDDRNNKQTHIEREKNCTKAPSKYWCLRVNWRKKAECVFTVEFIFLLLLLMSSVQIGGFSLHIQPTKRPMYQCTCAPDDCNKPKRVCFIKYVKEKLWPAQRPVESWNLFVQCDHLPKESMLRRNEN